MFCSRSALTGFTLLTFLLASPADLLAAAATSPRDEEPAREHTVFLGLKLVIEEAGSESPVAWADRDHVEVVRDGQRVKLPRRNTTVKSTLEPRIGRTGIKVDGLEGRRRFSYANDPDRAALGEQLALMSAQSDVQQAAELARYNAEADVGRLQTAASLGARVSDREVQEARVRQHEATRELETVYAIPQFDPTQLGDTPVPTDDSGVGGSFDAFEVSFEISAPHPIEDAVGVLRLFVRSPSHPELAAPVHKFFRLRRIGPEPKRVAVMQDRLPRGFAAEDFSVHVFLDGSELPSTASKSRVELTESEAHQFLILQHLQANAGGSGPVAIIPELLPATLRHLIPVGFAHATLDVVVDADGNVRAVTPAPATADAFSPELVAALQRVRFLPALVKGRPVEGMGTFALSEFQR